MKQSYEGKRVMVTGGSGFIGTALRERLAELPCEWNAPPRKQLDLTDFSQCKASLENLRPDIVIHLAGNTNRGSSKNQLRDLFQVNTAGTVNLLEACRLTGVKTVVTCGTADEFEGGINLYGRSKHAASEWVKSYAEHSDLNCAVARLFMVYGPGQSESFFLPALIKAFQEKSSLKMSPGHQIRDFVWVEDVVEALLRLAACEQRLDGSCVDICTGVPVSLRELVSLLEELTGRSGLAEFGALPYRPGGPYHLCGDPERLLQLTAFRPEITLRDGLKVLLGDAVQ